MLPLSIMGPKSDRLVCQEINNQRRHNYVAETGHFINAMSEIAVHIYID